MPLPTTKTPPKQSLSDYTILMYGPPKVGKSTFCAKAPDALFLATEAGLNSLDAFQYPVMTWEALLAACNELAAGDHKFKSVVIDTVDNAYKLCRDYICKRHKIDDPADLAMGKGHGLVNSELIRVLTRLSQLPYGLYLISHSSEMEVKTRTGSTTKIVPGLTGKTRAIIAGFVDIILFCDFEIEQAETGPVERRVIRTKPTTKYDAGDRTGRLPDPLPLDYGEFVKAFEAGAARMVPATVEKPTAKPATASIPAPTNGKPVAVAAGR